MDSDRAMQIIGSSETIDVLYNNAPVWLQGVNGHIAKVKFIGSDKDGEVPVRDLVEGGK